MKRRSVLKGLSGVLGAACGLIVFLPGVRFVMDSLRPRQQHLATSWRLARLSDLPVGQPVLLSLVGQRWDAWTHYRAETIGRVWLVRQTEDSVAPASAHVAAFSSVCPHVGCAIQFNTAAGHFHCPCHQAGFNRSGGRLDASKLGHENYSPRDMDALDCQVVQDEESQQWWVEIKYERFQQGLTTKIAKA